MKKNTIPAAPVQTQYIKFFGGLDLTTPVLSLKPGNALDATNYEPGLNGGFRRIDGFERVDGRMAPSAATYTLLEGLITGTIALGATVTGATSGATGIAIRVDAAAGMLCVTRQSGQFQVNEAIRVGGVTVGSISATPSPRGYRDAYNDALALAAAADLYRADIGVVPGQGPVRGVWMHKGVLYAFRDKVGGAAGGMYKATGAGWTAIDLGEEVRFTNANASVIEGATLTQGGVTATIRRVVLETGAFVGGVNTGRLILSGRAGGSFSAAAATASGGGTLTLAAAQSAIVQPAGGRYEFVSTNFGGASSTYRMYGCNGTGRAFEFDGAVFVPINTGMALDTPSFIAAHKKKLFLAFAGSVQYSGDGLPYQWTVLVGANEIGLGADITGMAVQAGDTLAIFTRSASYQLNGATSNSFSLLPISDEVGALPYTVQNVGKTYALDDRGLVSTDRTQAYGNFNQSTISAAVQPIIDVLRTKTAGAVVYRNRNQYRALGTDGSGIIASFKDGGLIGITQLQYPVRPTCMASCEDATGKDVVFFGADNGYVHQADTGSSFDGAPIEAYLRMPFNNINSPRMRKRFRKAVMEMAATSYAAIRFQPEFSYGDPDVGTHRLQTANVGGTGGYWDLSDWDAFSYDARLVTSPEFGIEGTGMNMALMFYSSSTIDAGHVLQGMQIHFTLRRLTR